MTTALFDARPATNRSSLRLPVIGYACATCWLFGWATATFDWGSATFLTVIAASPAALAWWMTGGDRSIAPREYVYLAILTVIAVGGTAFVVDRWFETGMDERAQFKREFHKFRAWVEEQPEYTGVEVDIQQAKVGYVHLNGEVATKESHDRLIEMLERIVRNAHGSYADRVNYSVDSSEENVLPSPADAPR